ncbi:glycoside hydrolase Chb [Streptomyces sp. SID7803]|nr:glycoside hydrolase Chb [Streptomyces sp. SID7803]
MGKVLKVARGTWTPTPSSYTYQWYAGGKAIKGATKTSLTLRTAQKGKKITVKVTARRTGHSDGSALSKATKAVVR